MIFVLVGLSDVVSFSNEKFVCQLCPFEATDSVARVTWSSSIQTNKSNSNKNRLRDICFGGYKTNGNMYVVL